MDRLAKKVKQCSYLVRSVPGGIIFTGRKYKIVVYCRHRQYRKANNKVMAVKAIFSCCKRVVYLIVGCNVHSNSKAAKMNTITSNETTNINLAINKIHGRKSKKMNFSIGALIVALTLGAVGYVGYTFPKAITVSSIGLALIASLCLLVGGYLAYTKSYTSIAILPICGISYIISKGGSTHSIVAMSSMIIPLIIGGWISSQMITKQITSLGAENNNKVKQLLTATYQFWKEGFLDQFSNQFKQTVEEKSIRDFIEDYYPFWNLFSWPLSKSKFNDTEFLIFLSKAVDKTSYILTNQKLFCFTIGDNPMVDIVNLFKIKSYEFTADTLKLNFFDDTITTINNLAYLEPIQHYLAYYLGVSDRK